jgi:FixJ family two-component response regulator
LSRIPIISIIDDDASVRSATARIIRSLDLVAHTFSSGPDFLESGQIYKTSCIIADVQMPRMSGLELQHVLGMRGFKIPMIFITAYPDEKIRTQALDAGAICFLDKPFDGPTLAECINCALGRSG